MTIVRTRAFFLLSLAFAVMALSVQFWAMGFRTRSIHMRALAMVGPASERADGIAQANAHMNQRPIFYCSGIVLAVVSLLLLVASLRKQEAARHSIPIGLLSFYAISLLLGFVGG